MMSNEEINRLADLIVQKIFDAEEKAQQEFMEAYEKAIATEEAAVPLQSRIDDLQKELEQALAFERYEIAAKIQKRIDNLKNL